MNSGSKTPPPTLPPDACERITEVLETAAERFAQALASIPTQPVPARLGQAVSAVLDSFDEVLGDLCKVTNRVTRHPSADHDPVDACSAPLRLSRADAETIYAIFRIEEERLNELIETVKCAAPRVDFQAWGPVFARTMGSIYIEILRPLEHQYPKLGDARPRSV